jgi:O-antigen ligase
MASRLRGAAAPIFLFLCLIVGGSGQGIWANMILQLIGLALIASAAIVPADKLETRDQSQLLGLTLIALAVVALQLVPLPPAVWQSLGPRRIIADGHRILGIASPWSPLSVAPYSTLSSLFSAIPFIAMLAAALRLGCRPRLLVGALVAATFLGILLGALQVGSANPEMSPWYLYDETNLGVATGFFANANHMADLLVITLPFLAAIFAQESRGEHSTQRYSAVVALVAGMTLVVVVGIALNGSLAGYALAVPVLLASASIALSGRSPLTRWLPPIAAILLIAGVGWLSTTPLGSGSALRSNAQQSVQSRAEIYSTSVRATAAFMPLGSGIGSFQQVYALYEDHDRLDPTTYVNHAHDDYLEIALEMGVPGIILMALFLGWWARLAWRRWRSSSADPFARAAVVASAAVLVHSLVDFPLRTAAVGACFAMCLALMLRRPPPLATNRSHLWPTRHVVLG